VGLQKIRANTGCANAVYFGGQIRQRQHLSAWESRENINGQVPMTNQ
jgi:hypothetical protein